MDTIINHTHLRVLWELLGLTLAHEYSSASSTPLKACHSCVLTPDASSQANPISPPANGAGNWRNSCYVDFQSRIYQIYWTYTLQFPDLSCFPSLDGTAHPVKLSDEMAKVWAASKLLSHGTDGCIRCSHLEPLPIIKIAHPNKVSRLRIQYEFEMLKVMKRCSLPVPLFGNEPLIDDEGIFGYRMELLSPIDYYDVAAVSGDLNAIVNRVHDCGLSHGDLHPSNVMRNSSGSLVLIDPSFSGPLGGLVPDHFNMSLSRYEGTTFCTTRDEEYLEKFFGVKRARVPGPTCFAHEGRTAGSGSVRSSATDNDHFAQDERPRIEVAGKAFRKSPYHPLRLSLLTTGADCRHQTIS